MLEKPYVGWTNIKIKNWFDRASYLTDIHLDFLNSLINSYKNYTVASIKYDAEGWEGIIVIDDYSTYIIKYEDKSDKPYVLEIEIDKDDVSKELIKDIENNLEEWCAWDILGVDEEQDKEQIKKNKKIILKLISELKKVINEYNKFV
jgi:hypothetical protein